MPALHPNPVAMNYFMNGFLTEGSRSSKRTTSEAENMSAWESAVPM